MVNGNWKMDRKKRYYIFSFPKSGRMWNICTLANYFSNFIDGGFEFKYKDISYVFEDMKNIGSRDKRYIGFPFIVTDHNPISDVPDGEKGALIVRNILDTLVSFYFHLGNSFDYGDKERSIDNFINFEIEGLCSHLDWSIRECERRGFMVITYETLGEIKTYVDLLEYFGFEVDNELLKLAINKSNFKSMRALEENNLHADIDSEKMRMRKGEVGGYINYLSVDQIDRYKKVCRNIIKDWSRLNKYNIMRF